MIIDFSLSPVWKAIGAISGGTVSLDGYWTSAETKTYVDEAVSGISLDGYWTSAQTQSAITAVEDHLYDVEEVTASALTELHTGLLEVSARTVDLSGYYTSAQTEQAITNKNYVTSAQVETQITDKNYITSAYVSDALTAYTPTSGFSTINGSAITSGGNITIETPEMTLPLGYEAVNDELLEDYEIVTLDGKVYGDENMPNDIPAFKWFGDGYSDSGRGYVVGNGCYVYGYYDENDDFVPVFLPPGTYAIKTYEGEVINLFYGKIGDDNIIYTIANYGADLDETAVISPLFTVTEYTCPTTDNNYKMLYLDYKDNSLASQVEEIAQVTAGAINQLQSTKVGSEDIGNGVITKIVKIEQTPYDDLVNNDETDPETLYVVVPDSM